MKPTRWRLATRLLGSLFVVVLGSLSSGCGPVIAAAVLGGVGAGLASSGHHGGGGGGGAAPAQPGPPPRPSPPSPPPSPPSPPSPSPPSPSPSGAPAAPSNLSATPSGSGVALAWTDNATDEIGCRVERRRPGGAFAAVGTLGANAVSFSDAGAQTDAFEYRVFATNAAGDSSPSNTASVLLVPTSPTGLAGTPGAYQVQLAWTDASSSETGFRVERRPAGSGSYAAIGTVGAGQTQFLDAGPSPDASYEYRALALNAVGDSAPSNTASVTLPPAAPSITGVAAGLPPAVDVSWSSAAPTQIGFRIERSVRGANAFTALASVGAAARSYFDVTSAFDAAYDYRVFATSGVGDSAASNVVGITLPPSPPTGLSATSSSSTRVDLTWTDASSTENGFRIERSVAGAGAFSTVATVAANVQNASDATVVGAASYDYRVIATHAAGDSPPSNVATVTAPQGGPSGPTDPYVARGRASAMLSWEPLPGAMSHTVYRGTSPGVSPQQAGVVSTPNAVSPHLVTGLTAGVTYRFVVTATTSAGETGPSQEVSVTPLPAPPGAPGPVRALPVTFSSINDLRIDRVRWMAYAVDENTNQLVVIDLVTEAEVARLPLSAGSRMLSLSPSLRWLVVVCDVPASGTGHLYLFDPEARTQTALHTIDVDAFDVEVLDSAAAYVPSVSQNEARVYDARTGASLGIWGTIADRTLVRRTPDQRRIYGTHLFGSPPEIYGWRVPGGSAQSLAAPDETRAVDAFIGTDTMINSDGTRGLTSKGVLVALGEGPGGATISAPIHTFADKCNATTPSNTPGVAYGFDNVTGELVRYDLTNLTTQRLPGYDASIFGRPRNAELGPGGRLYVFTTMQRIVLVPEPGLLAFVTQPSNARAGQPIVPAVQVAIQDGAGNTIAGANDPVTIQLGNAPGGGALSGTLTVNAVNGVATFADLRIDRAGSGYTLAARSGAMTAVASGMVSWWRGEGDASDALGRNQGTLVSGAGFAPGKVGQAFSLDGADDHVEIGDTASLRLPASFTLEAWANPTDVPEGQLASVLTKWGQSTALDCYGLWLTKSSGIIRALGAVGDGSSSDGGMAGGTVPAGTWMHVATTYDAATDGHLVYVNGQQVAFRVRGGGTLVSDRKVFIGREDSPLTRCFSGLLDELSIYDRALGASEVANIHRAGSAGKSAFGSALFDVVP